MHIVLVTEMLGEKGGGLVSAVCELADALTDSGATVAVFALHLGGRFGHLQLPRNKAVRVFVSPPRSPAVIDNLLAIGLRKDLSDYCIANDVDIVHANGFWLPSSMIAAGVAKRFHIPFILSPHGLLQPWAFKYRAYKKKVAWYLYGKRCISRASLLHAASEAEYKNIRALGISRPVAVIPNIVPVPKELPQKKAKWGNKKTILFLSRIHPSKGVMDLLAAWRVSRQPGWQVVIAGHDEENHLARVRRYVEENELGDEIILAESVKYADRWATLREASLFVLPTYSENFGITVAEALACGVPVITTRAAPWSVIEQFDCGWWIDVGPEALATALSDAMRTADSDLLKMAGKGQAIVCERFSSDAVTPMVVDTYRWAIGAGAPPKCVLQY